MWIFTKHGFISATTSPVQPKRLQLRFRSLRQMQNISHQFDLQGARKGKVFLTKHSDYPARIILKRKHFVAFMQDLAISVTYGNFKNSIPHQEGDYKHACTDTWHTMSRFQGEDLGYEAYGRDVTVKPDQFRVKPHTPLSGFFNVEPEGQGEDSPFPDYEPEDEVRSCENCSLILGEGEGLDYGAVTICDECSKTLD